MCRICVNQDPETAKNNFYKNIEKLNGKVIGEYKGKDIPVECICKDNHKCNPRPGCVQQGQGICLVCVNHDSNTAKNNFIKSIKQLGGKVIGVYKNTHTSVECICKDGHECYPLPHSIQQGSGMCGICKYKTEKILIEYCSTLCNASSQFSPEWCININTKYHFRYDVLLFDKLIIELDGGQHFKDVEHWNSISSEVQSRDVYKMKKAFDNGYSLLRLSQEEVWKNKIDWKQIIKDCLEELETDSSPKIWFHCIDENLYESHVTKLIECFTDVEAEKRIELDEEILEEIENDD